MQKDPLPEDQSRGRLSLSKPILMLSDTNFPFILARCFPTYTSVHPLCLMKSDPVDTVIGFPAQHPACAHLLPSRFLGIILPVGDFFTRWCLLSHARLARPWGCRQSRTRSCLAASPLPLVLIPRSRQIYLFFYGKYRLVSTSPKNRGRENSLQSPHMQCRQVLLSDSQIYYNKVILQKKTLTLHSINFCTQEISEMDFCVSVLYILSNRAGS